MQVGDEVIYRLRDYAPSERVRVVAVQAGKKSQRYDIEFLDGPTQGKQENVPAARIRGPWSGVAAYDEVWGNWERAAEADLTEHESDGIFQVFELLIPADVATLSWRPVRQAVFVADTVKLETLTGIPFVELASQVHSFTLDGDQVVSPEGALVIAELACHVNPMPVLEWIVKAEKEYQQSAKHGRTISTTRGESYTSSPEWEYEWYLERVRPRHELLRAWCGQRAVSMQERLGAAEAEVNRLGELIERLLDELKRQGHSLAAEHIALTYSEDRITAYNWRPTVDRPLKPSEIPVHYIRTRQQRWW
ncbi:hypothetical protein QUV83_03240 [Cellulomonas cellasea]|uniref:hypothetical protein n=1 Tax=Cellulomonas cellasea TaxID=43670 RepID=UPI0025A4464B|nr:hypothetical protein [Cellulomonas cellasea]MDM8083779.1 hypothetical protein [Cellulomonas cellasea]